MNKVLLNLLVIAMSLSIKAQITTPQPSPAGTQTQKVGLTDVTVTYSRPGVKGRRIFGGLVKYGKTWRTGANENTKITFSTDITLSGYPLKKGTYALYIIPNEKSWDVIFYTDTKNWGVPKEWNEAKVAAKLKVDTYKMPMKIETFTISVDDITNTSAVLGLLWENTYVGVTFEVPTDKIVMANIADVMSASPKAGDYYNAAVYYSENNKDIKTNKAAKINSYLPINFVN